MLLQAQTLGLEFTLLLQTFGALTAAGFCDSWILVTKARGLGERAASAAAFVGAEQLGLLQQTALVGIILFAFFLLLLLAHLLKSLACLLALL